VVSRLDRPCSKAVASDHNWSVSPEEGRPAKSLEDSLETKMSTSARVRP